MHLTSDASHDAVKLLMSQANSSTGKLIENQHGGWSAWLLARVRGAVAGGVASRAAGAVLPPAPPPKAPRPPLQGVRTHTDRISGPRVPPVRRQGERGNAFLMRPATGARGPG